jgi:hypothetical protein
MATSYPTPTTSNKHGGVGGRAPGEAVWENASGLARWVQVCNRFYVYCDIITGRKKVRYSVFLSWLPWRWGGREECRPTRLPQRLPRVFRHWMTRIALLIHNKQLPYSKGNDGLRCSMSGTAWHPSGGWICWQNGQGIFCDVGMEWELK